MKPLPAAAGAAGSPNKILMNIGMVGCCRIEPKHSQIDPFSGHPQPKHQGKGIEELQLSTLSYHVCCNLKGTLQGHPSVGFDVRTQTSAAIAVGIAMTGKVDHGSLTIAKCCKKSYVHEVIVTRGTSLRQGTLISVLTPVNSNSTSINSNNEEKNH
ncbi:hypothetical protein SCA6_015078 [Theobroma cacao]